MIAGIVKPARDRCRTPERLFPAASEVLAEIDQPGVLCRLRRGDRIAGRLCIVGGFEVRYPDQPRVRIGEIHSGPGGLPPRSVTMPVSGSRISIGMVPEVLRYSSANFFPSGENAR